MFICSTPVQLMSEARPRNVKAEGQRIELSNSTCSLWKLDWHFCGLTVFVSKKDEKKRFFLHSKLFLLKDKYKEKLNPQHLYTDNWFWQKLFQMILCRKNNHLRIWSERFEQFQQTRIKKESTKRLQKYRLHFILYIFLHLIVCF